MSRSTLLFSAPWVEWLRLGPDGRYLYHYWFFRKATTPKRLPEPFGSLVAQKNGELLRTVIWWCLRARKEEYVEVVDNDDVRVEFAFVLEEVLKDLSRWCGPETGRFPGLAEEVETELDRWLRYSRLDFSGKSRHAIRNPTQR